jgi:hypothetical protein
MLMMLLGMRYNIARTPLFGGRRSLGARMAGSVGLVEGVWFPRFQAQPFNSALGLFGFLLWISLNIVLTLRAPTRM